jgi:CheY-like chemotaxis protein
MKSSDPILLVEDNDDDVFFMRSACAKAAITNPLFVVEDGQKAIDYLTGTGAYADRTAFPLPRLVLLDLKLPIKKGFEVLAWLRQQDHLNALIVVVLTSSNEPSDIREAYRLHANSYLVKPTTVQRLTELAASLKSYWLEFNAQPPAGWTVPP